MVGWLFGSFVVLLLIGTPIAASLGLAAVITIVMSGMRVNMVVVGQTMFAGMTSYQLMAIPLFILCGNLMCDGGLSKKLVDFINLFCRKSKGALAYVTILASAFFAAISGSSPATTAAIGGIMAPECRRMAMTRISALPPPPRPVRWGRSSRRASAWFLTLFWLRFPSARCS